MDYLTFIAKLRERGFRPHPKNETLLSATVAPRSPALGVTYEDGRPTGIVEVPLVDDSADDWMFTTEPTGIDAEFHFAAGIIGSIGANEFLHVREPGPYFDHVFYNVHDDGDLSLLEDMIDPDDFNRMWLREVYSEEPYEEVSKQTRLEWQPFFQNPVARSLAELLARMDVKARA